MANIPRVALIDRSLQIEDMTEDGQGGYRALLRELRRLGHIDGQTITIERWTGRGLTDEAYAELARRIADTRPNVVIGRGGDAIVNFGAATTTVPYVGVGTFPEEFHDRLARPGGNITGFDFTAGGAAYTKMVQLLHDAVPSASRIAFLGTRGWWQDKRFGSAARLGAVLTLEPVFVDQPITEATIQGAFVLLAGFDAVYVASALGLDVHFQRVSELMLAARLPAIGTSNRLPQAGLLMGYSANGPDIFRRAAGYVDRILKGDDPADLPVQQPMKFDFVINLKTARALGITLPPALLIQATEFIE